MVSFSDLGLSEAFLRTLSQLHIHEPTDIQEKTIPLGLAGKDVIGCSATGSGKTLAFGAGLIENLRHGEGIQSLILAPTRELAEQVGVSLQKFARHTKLHTAIIYGGVGMAPQIDALERADIVVGTPGRILDHLERGSFRLSKIKVLILDEADRMLDMGFIEDVTHIIEACPRDRQTLLFSATISPDIAHIAQRYMKSPSEVSAGERVDPSKLVQTFYDVPKHLKFSLLVHLLKQEKRGLVMVFCNTRHNADFVATHLKANGVQALAIHGGLTQSRRNRIMEIFRTNEFYVLVCTDVAARGLDIKGVSHVYNYDLPPNSKEYIHRIGRTARAGSEGKALSLVSDRDYDNFRMVLRDDTLKIEQTPVPELEPIQLRIERRSSFRGGGRGRPFDSRRGSGRSSGRYGSRGSFGRGRGR
ncbi:MAG: DEAD/DEAH box helicase [Nanoarchaeota archaeon]